MSTGDIRPPPYPTHPHKKQNISRGWTSDLPPPLCSGEKKGTILRKTSIKGGWCVLNFKTLNYGENILEKKPSSKLCYIVKLMEPICRLPKLRKTN